MPDRKIGLTIFLLKDKKVQAFEEELIDPFRGTAIALTAPWEGFFVPLPAAGDRPPDWVSPVSTLLTQPIGVDMGAKSPGGLLVIRHQTRTFVITFGHAWQKLDDAWLERDFGLRVALNVIPERNLSRFVRSRSLQNGI